MANMNNLYHECVLSNITDKEIVKKVKEYLEKGDSNINEIIEHDSSSGTILHHAILNEFTEVVEYALNMRANIALEMRLSSLSHCKPLSSFLKDRLWNAVELAILINNSTKSTETVKILKMVKKRSLEEFACYGLTLNHFQFAEKFKCNNTNLSSINIKEPIKKESPLWGNMTPLLIAAKFHNESMVKFLLEQHASPADRDLKNNTALHFLCMRTRYYNEKLLLTDDEGDKPGGFNGFSHFHMACLFYGQNPELVKISENTLVFISNTYLNAIFAQYDHSFQAPKNI